MSQQIRRIILKRLTDLDRSRYWLGKQAERRGIANAETILRFLRAERDTSSEVVWGLFKILGLEVKPIKRKGKP